MSEDQHLQQRLDAVYAERNQLVALLARMAYAHGYRAGVAEHPDTDVNWDDDWRCIVMMDLPVAGGDTVQTSWHLHDSERPLVDGLPAYTGKWDGHTTEEKYHRLQRAFRDGKPRSILISVGLIDDPHDPIDSSIDLPMLVHRHPTDLTRFVASRASAGALKRWLVEGCGHCATTGFVHDDPTDFDPCPKCNGSGYVENRAKTVPCYLLP